RGPGLAVGGGAEHDVVGRATAAEAAVGPSDVDLARAVDLGGCQARAVTEPTGDTMELDRADVEGSRVARAPIGRDVGVQAAALDGNDDRAVRLDHWLAAEYRIARDGGGRPRRPAVRRAAHVEERVVPLDVAVAVGGAGRAGVAGDPALVVEGAAA